MLEASITTDMFNYTFKPSMEYKLNLFAKFGFRYIHWCDDWNNTVYYSKEDIKVYSQLINSASLRCLDVHGTSTRSVKIDTEDLGLHKEYVRLLRNRIIFCAEVGGDAVVIHPPGDKQGEELTKSLCNSIKVLDEVRGLCNDLNVSIAIENSFQSDFQILNFYWEKYPSEFVAFCFDSGHANLQNNFDQLKVFGDRLKVLHLNDNRGERDDHQPPFWGTVDWVEVTKWLKEVGYHKPINFEITHRKEFFKGTIEEFLQFTVKRVKEVLKLFY